MSENIQQYHENYYYIAAKLPIISIHELLKLHALIEFMNIKMIQSNCAITKSYNIHLYLIFVFDVVKKERKFVVIILKKVISFKSCDIPLSNAVELYNKPSFKIFETF